MCKTHEAMLIGKLSEDDTTTGHSHETFKKKRVNKDDINSKQGEHSMTVKHYDIDSMIQELGRNSHVKEIRIQTIERPVPVGNLNQLVLEVVVTAMHHSDFKAKPELHTYTEQVATTLPDEKKRLNNARGRAQSREQEITEKFKEKRFTVLKGVYGGAQ